MVTLMSQEYQGEVVFQISSRLVIRNPVHITTILRPRVGSLKDRVVGDGHLDESSCVLNFIIIGHEEPCQDDPVLHPGVGSLMDWLVGDGHLDGSETPWRSSVSIFMKIGPLFQLG